MPQTQARLDIFLNPDEKSRLQSELQTITDKYGRLALFNIELAEASLASAREAITGLLSDKGDGHDMPKKIEVKTRVRNLPRSPIIEETAVDPKSACVLSLVQKADSAGISRADLAESLRHNSVFNPKNAVVTKLVARVTFYLKKLKEAGLVENRGKTTTARWYALDGTSDQSETYPRTSARVTDDDNQQIVLSALGRHSQGISLPRLSTILCVNKQFNTQHEGSSAISSKVLHYLEKLQEQGLTKSEKTKDGTVWFSVEKSAKKEVSSATSKKEKQPTGAKVSGKRGNKKRDLNPTKMDILRLVGKNPGISGKEFHTKTSGYLNLRDCDPGRISNSLSSLKEAGLIVNKGKNTSNSCWNLTAAGKKKFEGSGDNEKASGGDSKKADKRPAPQLKDLPKRPPPQFKAPSVTVAADKLKELSAGSEDWEKLTLALLRGLEFPPTFEELVQVARSHGRKLGYNVDVSEAFLENQVRAVVLQLKKEGRIVQEGEEIQLVLETSPKAEEDDPGGSDSELEIFEQEVETEDAPDLDLPSCPSNPEVKKITLDSDSTDSDWQSAILEAITEICAADDNQEFSLEQLFDCFREKGGTNNFGISVDLSDSDFEDRVDSSLASLENQSFISMSGDQTWRLV